VSLLRNNLVVASGTALSRVTGVLRVTMFGIVVGQAAVADVYRSANQSPNAIYELLLGGVLSASLIPLFTKQAEDRDDEATSAVITVGVIVLIALTAVAVAAAPVIFRLFSLDVAEGVDPDVYRSAGTALARIFLVQIFFYGLTSLASALLNARRRYFAAAWAPVLSNLVIIASLVLVKGSFDGGTPALSEILTNDRFRLTLGLGTTIGIAVMALALVPAVRATEIDLRWNPNFKHPAVHRLMKLSTWTLGYVVANQIAVVIVQNLADPGSGQVAAYGNAYIFFVLPHGLLAMSIATTFEPEMARGVKQRDKQAFVDKTSLGIRLIALMTFPAGMLMFTLRRPIIAIALQHGQFTALDTLITSRALAGLSVGLVGFSVYLFTLRAFYAHGDARTPFVINLFENLLNIVIAVVLSHRYGVLGLGLGFGIAYLLSALWALQVLSFKVPGFPLRDTLISLGRIALASIVLAETAWLVGRSVGGNTGAQAILRVVAASIVGIIVYLGVLTALGVRELEQLRNRLRARFAAR